VKWRLAHYKPRPYKRRSKWQIGIVCTENLIRVDAVMESRKLTE
jgi:hypothetical protein